MIISRQGNGLHWFQSDLLKVCHGMFTRTGGCSPAPWDSLNLSHGVGDRAERVEENRTRTLTVLGVGKLASAVQVHGCRILKVDNNLTGELQGYDALITDQPSTGLLIQQADCQAILLHAPDRQVIGAVHSGWRGSVADIAGKTVALMQDEYGCDPAVMRAVISPSLGPCCAEFVHYARELPRGFLRFQCKEAHFDFWSISRWQLEKAGLQREHIDSAEICTRCEEKFFSYRRASAAGNPVTGRNGSIIALP